MKFKYLIAVVAVVFALLAVTSTTLLLLWLAKNRGKAVEAANAPPKVATPSPSTDVAPVTPFPDFSPVPTDVAPAGWINDQPEMRFESLSRTAAKLGSGPEAGEFGNFGPGVPGLDPYLRTDGPTYQIVPGGLKRKAMPYTDRKYEILQLPEILEGLTLVQTRNGHKGVTDPRFSIVLTVEKPAYLFLAIDERMVRIWQRDGAPDWLKDFSPTGYRIVTDDPTMHELRPYQVVTKKVGAGEVRLGPPWNQFQRVPAYSMYFVFLGNGKPKP